MTELDFKTIGAKVRQRRKFLGLTQEYVADQLDVNPSHISNIECGRVNPSLTALVRISNALTCSIDTFLSDEYSFLDTEETQSFIDSQLRKKIDTYDEDRKWRLLKMLELIW